LDGKIKKFTLLRSRKATHIEDELSVGVVEKEIKRPNKNY
jgi:hypothetical protein